MFEMKKILILFSILMRPLFSYADNDLNNWSFINTDKFNVAYVRNDSNSEFGLLCQDKCLFYLNTKINCIPKKEYLVMVVTNISSITIMSTCEEKENSKYLIFNSYQKILDLVEPSKSISFVASLDAGSVSVSLFNTDGAKQLLIKSLQNYNPPRSVDT